ncbi:MAG: hypothetical protein JJT96_19970 [Opitutales bacterium]|nr:hypothetical protein [Opitutales bacterium]
MARPRTHPQANSSGYTPALFAGLLALLLGMSLAAASLIQEPVREMTVAPREGQIETGRVYFLKGRDGGRSAVWASALETVRGGAAGVVSLDETDLNFWARTRLAPPPAARPAGDDEAPASPRFLGRRVERLTPPNFRIEGERLQMGLTLPGPFSFSGQGTVVYQVQGLFVSSQEVSETPPVFAIARSNFGQLPVGFLSPVAEAWLLAQVMRLYGESEAFRELETLWSRLESAEIVDGRLNLRFRAEITGS